MPTHTHIYIYIYIYTQPSWWPPSGAPPPSTCGGWPPRVRRLLYPHTHTHTRVVRVAPDRPMTDQPARPPIYLSNKSNADANKADVKPYFLPIKNAGKIPRVDHDYHDALKSTWEGLKVSQSPYSRLRVGGSDMVCPYSRLQ